MDDKGPVVAAIYALAALKDAGFAPATAHPYLFGTNERTGCGDMAWYREHGGEKPVMGFTPDGEYPVINGEKGILTGTFARRLHQTGVYRLTRLEGGTASNVVPAYAVAELQCPADAAGRITGEKITVTPIKGGIVWRRRAFLRTAPPPSRVKTPSGGWRWRWLSSRSAASWPNAWPSLPDASAWRRAASRSVLPCGTRSRAS